MLDGNEAAEVGIVFPSYQALLPEELMSTMQRNGFEIEVLRGIASLCRFISEEVLLPMCKIEIN